MNVAQSVRSAHAVHIDHLVVAAPSLEAGVQHVASSLDIDPALFSPGGQHPGMGTHNTLLGLWGGVYLEVIAVDPTAPAPERKRWFGLDGKTVKARLADGPYLAHWVARVERPRQLALWQKQYPDRIAPLMPMQRGDFAWHIGVPENGAFPSWKRNGDGVLPSLIQWDLPVHPSDRLPYHGVALKRLNGFHANVASLTKYLDWLGATSLISLEPTLVGPSLAAEFDTPQGPRTLR
ncbi:Glyoxalase-like domain-containing protein [Pararobbsia alpina]|uniref:VOC family protein n=1 Tax=Pararobbsia alpina TaxID=621374 RepID=UPI0039A446B8